ncbi:unnamed protein product [Calypogeia fissa]
MQKPSTEAVEHPKGLKFRPPVSYEDLEGELLPGIPNDFTLQEIAPYMCWRQISALTSISSHWEKAIKGHLVLNAKQHGDPAKTFALFARIFTRARGTDLRPTILLLYSMRDQMWFELPPIPGLRKGFPQDCQCVSLDSKIYVLGGACNTRTHKACVSAGRKTVYMLDLTEQKKWKQCAPMQEARQAFGAGVINGKIHVFGGVGKGDRILRGAEVYDAELDFWSPIKPMVSEFYSFQWINTIGEELCVEGYTFYKRLALQIYDPVKDEWRWMPDLFRAQAIDTSWAKGFTKFIVGGILHAITLHGIYVFDTERSSWSLLEIFSFPREEMYIVDINMTVLLENELLVEGKARCRNKPCLLQSKGFGNKTKGAIEWEIVEWPPSGESAGPGYNETVQFICSV